MKSLVKTLNAAETASLSKWLSTRVFENIARMSKSSVLYGQPNPDRDSRRGSLPSEELFAGLVAPAAEIPPGQDCPPHRGVITTVLKGSLTAAIGETVYTARQGDWFIVPPNVRHPEFCLPSRTPYHLLWFHQEPPDVGKSRYASMGESTYSRQKGFLLKAYRAFRKPPLETQRAMESILAAPDQPVELLRLNVMRFVVWWLDLLLTSTNGITVTNSPIVERIQALLEQPDVRTLSVKRLSAQVGASCEHISRLFHSSTGQTLRQRIQVARIERAKQCLTSSSLSIKEIAYLVGFASSQHFARAFQRSTGLLPSSFREGAQAEKIAS